MSNLEAAVENFHFSASTLPISTTKKTIYPNIQIQNQSFYLFFPVKL
jgi:hypothetical protein